ncbi:MAG: hypothetical protein WCP28_06110 [Actinomycetes bacterium]
MTARTRQLSVLLTVLLGIGLAAVLVGCGSGGSSSGGGSPGPTSTTSTPATSTSLQLDADSAGSIEKINNIYNTSIVSNDPNAFKAEYEAGFIQGKLQKDQIPAARDNNWDGNYLTDPKHSFPTQLPPPPSQLNQAQRVLQSNWEFTLRYIRDTAKAEVQTNLRRLLYRLVGIYDGATKSDPQALPFDGQWYPQFSPAEMAVTYETPAPTFMDIYYLNNTGDLFNFLPPPTSGGSSSASASPVSLHAPEAASHCTAFIKRTVGDIFLSHNTWSAFLDQSQATQLWVNGDFMSSNAIDPAYLGSGTDFGYTNKGLIWNETTEDATKGKGKVESLWTSWRETLAEQYADSIDTFFKYISLEQSGSYMNGYMLVDTKQDKLGYVEMSTNTTVFFTLDAKGGVQVTTKPAGLDTAYDKKMVQPNYILGFNYPASMLIRKQLAAINNRPARQVQLLAGINGVNDVESAKALITYTAPDNPLSIYGRWDLGYGETTTPQKVPDGSIDAKVVSASMAQQSFGLKGVLAPGAGQSAFWMKYGTASVAGKPFIWSQSPWSSQKLRYVPDVVDGTWTLLNTNIS